MEESPRVQPWQANAIIGLLALLVVSTIAANFQAWTSQPKPPVYEYTFGSVPDKELDKTLANFGADGWELVFARRASGNPESAKPEYQYEMIFRRQVRGVKPIKGP